MLQIASTTFPLFVSAVLVLKTTAILQNPTNLLQKKLIRNEAKENNTHTNNSTSEQQKSTISTTITSMISEIGQRKLNAALQRYSEKAAAENIKANSETQLEKQTQDKEEGKNNNSPKIIQLSFDEDNKSLIDSIRHDISIVETCGIPPASSFLERRQIVASQSIFTT